MMMSHHVITLQTHGTKLSIDRGLLVCKFPDGYRNPSGEPTASMGVPYDEVRLVVCTTPAVSVTGMATVRLSENNAAILYCNEHYQPTAWTMPLFQTKRHTLLQAQLNLTPAVKEALWRCFVKAKIANQAYILECLGNQEKANILHGMVNDEGFNLNESHAARLYWQPYYAHINELYPTGVKKRTRHQAEDVLNARLNYGYAILKTLIHRACLISGLLPVIGLHHQAGYKGQPLVYDVVEPYRCIVDLALLRYMENLPERDVTDLNEDWKYWTQYVVHTMREYSLTYQADSPSKKLIDLIDLTVSSLGRCLEQTTTQGLILPYLCPTLRQHHFEKAQNATKEEAWILDDPEAVEAFLQEIEAGGIQTLDDERNQTKDLL
jgi:CRISPR-associated protein Cas1